MDGDIDENIREPDDEIIESIVGFEDLGIDGSILRDIAREDENSFRKIQFRINRMLLEGASIENINDSLKGSDDDNVNDPSFAPILVGSPLLEDNLFDMEPDPLNGLQGEEEFDDNIKNISEKSDIITNIDKEEELDEKPPLSNEKMPVDDDLVKQGKNITGKKTIRKRNKIMAGSASAIIIMIIIAGIVINENIIKKDTQDAELTADFFISDLSPVSGALVTLSSLDKDNELEHRWDIFPENFVITNGNLEEKNITLYFKNNGTYRIEKIISRDDYEKSIFKDLEVIERKIRVDRESFGDLSNYHVAGDMTLMDISDMIPYSEVASYESLYLQFETEKTNPMSIEIDDIETGSGPFGDEYDRYVKISNERLKVHGYLEREDGGRSPITGNMDVIQENYIDLFYKRSIEERIIQDSVYTIQLTSGNSLSFETGEKLRIFPSKMEDYFDLKIEDISDDRYFSPGESGNVDWGYYTLLWKAIEVQRISDEPCVMLEIYMDENTKRELSLKEFEMRMWLSDGYPVSMRTVINLTSMQDGKNGKVLNIKQQLLSFEKGEQPIIYRLNQYQHDYISSIEQLYSEFSEDLHDDWDKVPSYGTFSCSIPSNFNAEDAYSSFSSDLNYRQYSSNREGLYSIYTNFSRMKDITSTPVDKWVISLGMKEDDLAWNETVTREYCAGIIARVDPPSMDRNDLSPILTYSGSEEALKRILSDVDEDSATSIFGTKEPGDGNKIDLTIMSISTKTEKQYPRMGSLDPSLSQSIDMCYVISYLDGSLEVGLDMNTGQLAFIREYSNERL